MSYYVDIPKPKAWPPPRAGAKSAGKRIRELLAYGYTRDPIGDKLHMWLACLFMLLLPVDEVPTTVGTFALFIYSALRLPSTWRTLIPMCNSTIFRLLVAWTVWSLLSITWSSNHDAGLDHAGAMRMVLLPLALWPVMRHWKHLLAAFLIGVFFQNTVQLSEVFSWLFFGENWLTKSALGNLSGLDEHPGKAALFMGLASLAWLGIIFGECKYRKIATCCFLLATAGMFATVSMAVALGYIAAILCIFLLTISQKKISSIQATYVILSLLLVASLAWLTAGDRVIVKTESVIEGVHGYIEGDVNINNSTQLRLHWWSQTLRQIFEDKKSLYGIVGHGFGSVQSIDFSLEGSTVSSKAEHVHNTFIQILYENGIIGLGLFIFLLWKTITTSKYTLDLFGGRLYLFCTAGIVLWSVATCFENSQSTGRAFATLILLVTLIMYADAIKPEAHSR